MVNELQNVCHPCLKSLDFIDILNQSNNSYDASIDEDWVADYKMRIRDDTVEAIIQVITWNSAQAPPVDSVPSQSSNALFIRPNALRDSLSSLANNRGKAVLSWMKFKENSEHSNGNALSPRYICIYRYM
jgi:hypothetical protein